MQLMLIVGIVFAIGAVMFALQNTLTVPVVFFLWRFESSLAMVLLIALGLGALIAGLVSSPAVIRAQWTRTRQRRQITSLEKDKTDLERRVVELEARLPKDQTAATAPEDPKPYVGLKSLMMGEGEKPKN